MKYAEQMIKKNIRVNNEFYVCPVFNEAIQDKKKSQSQKLKKCMDLAHPKILKHFYKPRFINKLNGFVSYNKKSMS